MALLTKKWLLFLTVCASVMAQQATDYIIVDAPIGTKSSEAVLSVKWAGFSRSIMYPAPDSGTIYYDRTPGGAI